MNNLYYSIPIIILCVAGYSFSYMCYKRQNFTIAVLLLMLCGIALQIYTASDFFLHTWDERYHALVAKNLIKHPLTPTLYDNPVLPYDFRNWTANHIWLHKQPLPLWTMAASMWAFGINEIALRLPSIILSATGIYFSFFIGNYFFNKKTGYLTSFLFSINGLIIELAAGRVATDHIDIFFLFFIQLAIVFSILFSENQKIAFNFITGACLGAAILSKYFQGFIIVPIWLLIVADSGKFKPKEILLQLTILLTTAIAIFLPWQIYIFHTFPAEAKWESSYNLRHITEVLEERTGPFYYYLDRIRINYGELIYLPLIWFIWKTIDNIQNKKNLAISIWILIPLVFFSAAKTKMQGYILFISPALFMITAEFFFMLEEDKKKYIGKWFINLLLFLLIALPVRYMIERVKPFNRDERNPEWAVDLSKLKNEKINNGVLFNYDKPVEAMFYTDLTAYPHIPDKNTIEGLMADGYTILINDDGNLSDTIKTINGILIKKLSTH